MMPLRKKCVKKSIKPDRDLSHKYKTVKFIERIQAQGTRAQTDIFKVTQHEENKDNNLNREYSADHSNELNYNSDISATKNSLANSS